MVEYFNQNIKPYNDALGRMLGVFSIPVDRRSSFDFITVTSVEDGLIVDCNHAGATMQNVDALEFDSDSGRFTPTGTEQVLVCDKCNKQSIPGTEEWL